jgi:cell division protein WhiA
MSFSAEAKRELCRLSISKKCCAQAEAYGILLYCNTFNSREVRIITESPYLKSRLPVLFNKAFRVRFDEVPEQEEGKGTFLIRDPEKLRRIFETFGHEMDSAPSIHVNFAVLEENHCRTAFFRGAFLAGGSVTDPEKSYHLELVTSHYYVSREMLVLLREAGFEAKETTRKSNYITYFKQSEHIEDFLTAIGAPLAAMEIMTSKLERDLRGSVNRRVNCDSANLDKTVAAAQNQIDAIRHLKEQGAWSSLPEKLRETAELRVNNPELTLSQLAELFQPPISKSALNHRLRKLVELSGAFSDT